MEVFLLIRLFLSQKIFSLAYLFFWNLILVVSTSDWITWHWFSYRSFHHFFQFFKTNFSSFWEQGWRKRRSFCLSQEWNNQVTFSLDFVFSCSIAGFWNLADNLLSLWNCIWILKLSSVTTSWKTLPFLKRIYPLKILLFTTWSEDPPASSRSGSRFAADAWGAAGQEKKQLAGV